MKERKLPGASGAIHKLARARHALPLRNKTYHLHYHTVEKPTFIIQDKVYFRLDYNKDLGSFPKADELQRLNGAAQ